MLVTRLDQLEACRQIADAWDCMPHGVPFRRTAWLHSWWNHFQGIGDLCVLQVSDERGEIVGIAPWFMDQSLRHGRVIRPLGSGDTCSEYLGILATTEHERQVIDVLTQWLVAAAEGQHGLENRWDLLDLVSVDAADPIMARFVDRLEATGNNVHRSKAMSSWRISLPNTWDEYLAMLSKSHRKRVRRIDRKWLESGATTLRTVTTFDELNYVLESLIRLHQQRQKSLGNAGCFADPAFSGFMREAARQMLQEDSLRLYWIELDDEPVAAEFQIVDGDVTYAYLGGMSSERSDSSPGQVIQVAILKQCIDQQQRAFDFLRGDETYKAHWAVQERACQDVRVVPRRHAAQLRHQMWVAGDAMKQWIRAGLQIAGVH